MTSAEVRQRLVDALILDLVGPIADPSRAGERLEQGPSRWYLTGFLVPNERASVDLPKEDDEDEEEDNDLFGSDDDPLDQPTAESVLVDDSDKNAAVVTSKRNFLPSSMGLSVLVPEGDDRAGGDRPLGRLPPRVRPREARAEPAEGSFALASAKPAPKPRKHRRIDAWARQQRETERDPGPPGCLHPRPAPAGRARLRRPEPGMARPPRPQGGPRRARSCPTGRMSVNVYLVNHRKAIHGALKDQAMAFQAELMVHCERRVRPPSQPERPSLRRRRRPRGRPPVPRRLRVRRRPQRLRQRRGRRRLHLQARPDRLGPPRPGRARRAQQAGRHHPRHGGPGEPRDPRRGPIRPERTGRPLRSLDRRAAPDARTAPLPATGRDLRDAPQPRPRSRPIGSARGSRSCKTPRPSGPSRSPTPRWPARPAGGSPCPGASARGRRRAEVVPLPARLPPAQPPGDHPPRTRRSPDRRPALLPDRRRQDRGVPRPGGLHPPPSPVPRRSRRDDPPVRRRDRPDALHAPAPDARPALPRRRPRLSPWS